MKTVNRIELEINDIKDVMNQDNSSDIMNQDEDDGSDGIEKIIDPQSSKGSKLPIIHVSAVHKTPFFFHP